MVAALLSSSSNSFHVSSCMIHCAAIAVEINFVAVVDVVVGCRMSIAFCILYFLLLLLL